MPVTKHSAWTAASSMPVPTATPASRGAPSRGLRSSVQWFKCSTRSAVHRAHIAVAASSSIATPTSTSSSSAAGRSTVQRSADPQLTTRSDMRPGALAHSSSTSASVMPEQSVATTCFTSRRRFSVSSMRATQSGNDSSRRPRSVTVDGSSSLVKLTLCRRRPTTSRANCSTMSSRVCVSREVATLQARAHVQVRCEFEV